MKTKITLLSLLCFITINIFAQEIKDTKIVDKGFYVIVYSEFYKNPLRAEYKLYKPYHVVDRKGMSFKSEKGLKTATNKDFESNSFDKGHCIDAESFSSDENKMRATFSYANCAVQHFQLNRGAWRLLEDKVRKIAQDDSLLIIVEVIFDKNSKQLPTGAYIPSLFKKTIIYLSTGKTREFIFPNQQCENNIYLYETVK